jgi:phosphonate transport system substrate-binding protein
MASSTDGSRVLGLPQRRSFTRRRFVAGALGAAALLAGQAVPAAAQMLRIGTTAVILDDQLGFLRAWRDYLQERLGVPVTFLQRGSYREITAMLQRDELDFAWVCGYPYVRNRDTMELVAMPNYGGKPLYRSYLIVPSTDTTTRDFAGLTGKVFAYSDPDSNSGFLIPQFDMLREGLYPPSHFRKAFFTYAHRKVVVAVGNRVAHGGAVDGYVWETLALRTPEIARRTRVAHKSDEYGFPPIVARRSLDRGTIARFRETLLAMPNNARGREMLKELNLDGFLPPEEEPFQRIARALDFVAAREKLPT